MFGAIDFGTSNSAIAIPDATRPGAMRLVELEPGFRTMPTAVFYAADAPVHGPPRREFGRAAIAAYVDGLDGRLMRSMKSILGSPLAERSTDVGGGRSERYLDVVRAYLAHLKAMAEREAGAPIDRVVLGRPVFFVDDDAARDALAERTLRAAAEAAGFVEVGFAYEPIAAAFDHEQRVEGEEKVLVADIGGGTSDFSLVRVGRARAARTDRRDDILASFGIHVAGTDFDRRVELAAILPALGFGAHGPSRGDAPAREVPSRVYFDLATWHLVNTLYAPQRVAELRALKPFFAEPRLHERLMAAIERRLGHALLAEAEAAKIRTAEGGATAIDLGAVEPGLASSFDARAAARALDAEIARIVETALETVRRAGVGPRDVDALYFTGGSTGLRLLAGRLRDAFASARAVHGDRFASVATGLGLVARRRYAPPEGRASSTVAIA